MSSKDLKQPPEREKQTSSADSIKWPVGSKDTGSLRDELDPASLPASVIGPGGELIETADDEEAFRIMRATPVGRLEELTGSYLEFKVEGSYYFKFIAMSTFKGDKGTIPAVKLVGEDGITYVGAQTVIVNSLQNVLELPAYVRIDYKGMKKSSTGGNYANVQVFVFPHVSGKK